MSVLVGYRRIARGEVFTYAVACIAMWPLPLLNRLHVESAAVLATVAFFAAGIVSLDAMGRGAQVGRVLGSRLMALWLPLVLMLIPMAWAPNCAWPAGIGFFLLYPVITVVLAVSLAAVVVRLNVRRRRTVLCGLGVGIIILGPLFDLGFHPQFYTYNHVFGGILGPLYDEELATRPGLFVFRAMTLVWGVAGLLWATGRTRPAVFALSLLVAAYLFGGRLGINTGYDNLRRALPGQLLTEHFEIRYDPAAVDDLRLRELRDLHEHEYARIAAALNLEVGERILTFVYPDDEARARLTGARRTSVAPVWLRRPQVHVSDETVEAVFPHELVHAFSREFGLPLINASLSVGLVEGLAVALEPPAPSPSPDDLVRAARTATGLNPGQRLPQVLSPLGFWTGRGGVSYTVTGSFVAYLLREWGPEPLKRGYALATIEEGYGRSVEELVDAWLADLDRRTWLDAGSVLRARVRLGAESLFERRCPHYVPPSRRALRRANRAWTDGDTTAALSHLDRALKLAPNDPTVMTDWTWYHRELADVNTLADTLVGKDPESIPVGVAVVRGDLLAVSGDSVAAREAFQEVLDRLPVYARTERLRVALRVAAAADRGVFSWILTGEGAARSEAGRALRGWREQEAELPVRPPAGLARWARRAWTANRTMHAARTAYRAGNYAEASELADQAAGHFEALGDLTMAAYVRHVASRYRFGADLPPLS